MLVHRSGDAAVRAAEAALATLFDERYLRRFGVALWDGTRLRAAEDERFVLHINDPGALRLAISGPVDLNAGRAVATGLLDVDGSMEDAVDELFRASTSMTLPRAVALARLLHRLPKTELPPLREAHLKGRLHSRGRDAAAIGFHYDQPIEFYRAFLDKELVYSCAYFDDGVETLDAAQSAKLDYALDKLRLRDGERLLDIGCGWGALVVRAAQRYGAHVLGITLSRTQYEETQRRIAAAFAGNRARVELRDYRDLEGEQFTRS